MPIDKENELDRNAIEWIEHAIRGARPGEAQADQLAKRYNAIAHETGFPVATLCEWIHNFRGEALNAAALRDHLRQVAELQAQIEAEPRLCPTCSTPLDYLHGCYFCAGCGEPKA